MNTDQRDAGYGRDLRLIASLENHLDREMAEHAAGLIPDPAG
ncbi:MAG: hypothetical protein QOE28_1223 [Solirubrobacteraceae bacterium]|jgi:hypothetical protein|nr:hypothetical protein [Solirubrobacteraceae bacterium]